MVSQKKIVGGDKLLTKAFVRKVKRLPVDSDEVYGSNGIFTGTHKFCRGRWVFVSSA